MKSMIDQAFRRYGMTVTVEHGAETGETHGFVQPVTAVSGGEPFSVGPLGAKLLRTSAVPAGKLIGLDKNYALEHICGSEVMVEYDKLIDRQIERAAITSISGFAKPYQEASKVLTV